MLIEDVIKGIKNNSISINGNGHEICKLRFINGLQMQSDFNKDMIATYKNSNDKVSKMYQEFNTVKIGHRLQSSENCDCHNCGENVWPIMTSETEITLCNYKECFKYEKLNKVITDPSLLPMCSALDLLKSKCLTSFIKIETGKLVFRNSFHQSDEIYDIPKGNSIESIKGRDELMQYLASKNVGYGQMTNTSVGIYSNLDNEIIIGPTLDYWEDSLAWWEDRDSDDFKKCYPTKEDIDELEKDVINANSFNKYISDHGFIHCGNISLSVWRWQCADKSVLDKHKIPPIKQYEDEVILDVTPGDWKIEHYFDFGNKHYDDDWLTSYRGDYIYSRLKLI